MITNEQQQAIAKYEDIAENGTLRPADRQDLRHLLDAIRAQGEELDEYVAEYGKHSSENQGRGCPACAAHLRVKNRARTTAGVRESQ